ncbi:hypothetical protein CHUAL_011103 [Chamberlinius hualienensis]
MLSDKEKIGVQAILAKMDELDVKSLADTITNRMLAFQSLDEALTAVLVYAKTPADILKRKKVKKEYLFQYLHDVGHSVTPNADKATIVKAALTYWDSKDAQEEIIMEEDSMICDESYNSQDHGHLSTNSIGQNNSAINNISNNGTSREVQEMAEQFTRWFYQVLHNGHLDNPNLEDKFGPHHFWRDCQFKIHTPQCEHLIEGSQATADRLLSLIGQDQLYFNPFYAQQGIKGYVDNHGLVIILVAGDIHRADRWVGVFEQKFGLIRDPASDNKWKIKFSELNFKGKEFELYPLGRFEDYALEYA